MRSSFVQTLLALGFVSFFASCSLAGSSSTPLPGGCNVCNGGEDPIPGRDEELYEAKSVTATSGLFRLPQDHTFAVAVAADAIVGGMRAEVELRVLQSDGELVEAVSGNVSAGMPVILEVARESVSTAKEPIFLQAQVVFKNLDKITTETYPVFVSAESGGVVPGASARSEFTFDLDIPGETHGKGSGDLPVFMCKLWGWVTAYDFQLAQ